MNGRINTILTLSLLMLIVLPVYGAGMTDRVGPVYPITEPDWLEWLPKQAEKRLRQQPPTLTKEQLKAAVQMQMPKIELPEVTSPRSYTINPSVRTSRPVTDQTGRIVVPAGTLTNPLERILTFRPILVIDGKKDQQVEWAKRLLPSLNPLVLLVGGDLFDVNRRLGVPVYPAPNALIEKFSIERVPVILSQAGKLIKVEEVVP